MDRIFERRKTLHELLMKSNPACCYFQPPDNTKLAYPAIVYNRKRGNVNYADNKVYAYKALYEIKVFDTNPDSPFLSWMLENVPGVNHNSHYTTNGLNVDVFSVYW